MKTGLFGKIPTFTLNLVFCSANRVVFLAEYVAAKMERTIAASRVMISSIKQGKEMQ